MSKKKVLIVKISSLGDILHAFPAVSLIAETLENPEIDWLVNPVFAPVLKYHSGVSGVIGFPRKDLASPLSFPLSFINLLREIREKKYDLVFDFQGLLRSALFAWFARSYGVAGFAETRERAAKIFYSGRITIEPQYVHAVEKNVRLVSKILGIDFKVPENPLPVVDEFRRMAEKTALSAGILGTDICLGVAPGARWESKRWPPEFFIEVLKKVLLTVPSAKIILFGTSDDLIPASKIESACASSNVINLCAKTKLGEFVEFIRMCRCFLSNDSGPMHLSAALGVPVVALFGPTDPEKTGPYCKNRVVFQADKSCIKCFKRYCYAQNFSCHGSIDSVAVADEIISILKPGFL